MSNEKKDFTKKPDKTDPAKHDTKGKTKDLESRSPERGEKQPYKAATNQAGSRPGKSSNVADPAKAKEANRS